MAPTIQRENPLVCVATAATHFLLRDQLTYASAYTWLVLVSAMDIMLTIVVIDGLQGIEANPLAAYVINKGGFVAASYFKYSLVVLAIILCEVVGRMKDHVGRRLSWTMVMIGSIPVVWTLSLLYSSIAIPTLLAD